MFRVSRKGVHYYLKGGVGAIVVARQRLCRGSTCVVLHMRRVEDKEEDGRTCGKRSVGVNYPPPPSDVAGEQPA